MGIILTIVIIYTLLCIFGKSEKDQMKEAERLPKFTKEDAEYYYNNVIKKNEEK